MRVRFCTRDVVALRTCVRLRNDVIHEMIDVLRPFIVMAGIFPTCSDRANT